MIYNDDVKLSRAQTKCAKCKTCFENKFLSGDDLDSTCKMCYLDRVMKKIRDSSRKLEEIRKAASNADMAITAIVLERDEDKRFTDYCLDQLRVVDEAMGKIRRILKGGAK